jgi:hypothetical protein
VVSGLGVFIVPGILYSIHLEEQQLLATASPVLAKISLLFAFDTFMGITRR